jgi:DNA-binding CsgD family transcriptional regulator
VSTEGAPRRRALPGRRHESATLSRLLEGVRDGRSAALVIRGEAGIGKTALLDDAVGDASDLLIVRAVGIESEMELPYAALHQLCKRMLDRLVVLPTPQRDALMTAFGRREGPAPDRFLVGLAVLSLLSDAGAQRSLVCVIDDAHWLDRASAQALAFAARRLMAESVLMIFAARERTEVLSGLPELLVEGLAEADSRALLESVVPWLADERLRDQIVAETRGNPLAILELSRGHSAAELGGGFGLTDAIPLTSRIEASFQRRIDALSQDARLLLVVAAAEPAGDSALVRGAAGRLGLDDSAAREAELSGLVDIGRTVVFRHPLVRSALYRSAAGSQRRRVHAALADATDPAVDPDRHAWHRAHATLGPDDGVAAELELSAGRAQRRGGLAAAAAFLERAALLTLDPALRPRRALAAARAKYLAGAPDAALRLLIAAEDGELDELVRARIDTLRAEIAYSQNRGGEAPSLLSRAATRLEPLDPDLARQTHLDALWAAHFAGRLARGAALPDVARAALAARRTPSRRPSDLLLDGLAAAAIDGYVLAVPTLQEAVRAFRSTAVTPEDELRWLWHAAVVAMDLWDDASLNALTARHIEVGREAGVLEVLPIALSARILALAFDGRLLAAGEVIDDLRTVTEAIGSPMPPYGPMVVAAWRGHEAEAAALIDSALPEATARGEGAGIAVAQYARAVLYNGLGRYSDALAAALESDLPEVESHTVSNLVLVELIEAAVRSGATEQAASALNRLSPMALASNTDWALGNRARSVAQLASGDRAEGYYQEAIERFARTRVRTQLARTHLIYGEWLRRENRRVDAREHLRTAYDMLSEMTIHGYAERARRELAATGEVVRRPSAQTLHELTSQEAQIARLASRGQTNPEIGALLFISPRTVEWHLGKVFTKLGVSSRRELRHALPHLDHSDVLS